MNDILAKILGGLGSFAQSAGTNIGTNLMAQLNPRAFEAQQLAERQLSSQDVQLHQQQIEQQHWQQQLGMQQAMQARQEAHEKFIEQLQMGNLIASGEFQKTPQGSSPDLQLGGQPLNIIPLEKRAGYQKPFTFTPTDEDRQAYPWLPAEGVTMPAKDFPAFIGDMSKLNKGNPMMLKQYGDALNSQLDTLFPNDADADVKRMYKFHIQDALASGDTKKAGSFITDLLHNKTEEDMAVKRQALEYSPAAIAGAARKAGAEQDARERAGEAAAVRQLSDATMLNMYKLVKRGVISPDRASAQLGLNSKQLKARWETFVARQQDGDPLPVPLGAKAQGSLMAIEPVLEDLKKFRTALDGVQGSDTSPMTFFKDRLAYSLGSDPEYDGLISQGEMDKIRGAGQSLTGLRASLPLLDKAFIHTPSFWMSSKGQMKAQVDNMTQFLENQTNDIYKYGAKSGIVQGPEASPVNKKQFSAPPPPTF